MHVSRIFENHYIKTVELSVLCMKKEKKETALDNFSVSLKKREARRGSVKARKFKTIHENYIKRIEMIQFARKL